MATSDDRVTEAMDFLEKQSGASGIQLTDDAWSVVRTRVERGVRLFEEDRSQQLVEKRSTAETSLEGLIDALKREAVARGVTNIDERLLEDVMKSYCPVYPFGRR